MLLRSIGETSAGKSSFINFILGRDILPQQLLSCTSTICRLKNKEKINVSVVKANDEREEVPIPEDANDRTIQDILKGYVSKESDKDNYKFVDINIPIPLLGDHAMIVDTPGIGTSDELTNCLLNYLPHAIAFIYIINSNNAGGVHGEKLLSLFQYQFDKEKRKHMLDFNPKTSIFICNKWEDVPEDEEEDVFKYICNVLDKNWPNLDREKQIFKFSVKKEKKKKRKSHTYTENYDKLLDGIKRLVTAALEVKASRHLRWQRLFMQRILALIISKTRHSKSTMAQKHKEKTKIEHMTKELLPKLKEIKQKVIDNATETCKEISQRLQEHLNKTETINRICTFAIHEYPERDSIYHIKEEARKLINSKIIAEIRQWTNEDQTENVFQDLFTMLRSKLGYVESELQKLNTQLRGVNTLLSQQNTILPTIREYNFLDVFTGIFFSADNVSDVLKWPIGFIVTTLMTPILFPLCVKDLITNSPSDYFENKKKYMDQWTLEFMKEINSSIHKVIQDAYLVDFKATVTELLDEVIPKRIDAEKKSLDNIVKDVRTSSQIRKQYQPLELNCTEIIGRILLLDMKYFLSICLPFEYIDSNKCIGSGSFATVFEVSIRLEDKLQKAAMKRFKVPVQYGNSTMYEQLAEVEKLQLCRHRNIVDVYGFSYKCTNDYIEFEIFMEFCECSLHQFLFEKKLPWTPCFASECLYYCKEAFQFYMNMMRDVCAGLSVIHDKGLVHRDIKLRNILINNGTAKIADFGITKRIDEISGTKTGTLANMAPEVYEEALYGTEADIYSVGIILWEMWYCRPAYTSITDDKLGKYEYNCKTSELHSFIKVGIRPDFETGTSPPEKLKSIIQKCWDSNADIRPTAQDLLKKLEEIHSVFKM